MDDAENLLDADEANSLVEAWDEASVAVNPDSAKRAPTKLIGKNHKGEPLSSQELFDEFRSLYGTWLRRGHGSPMPDYDDEAAQMAGDHLSELIKQRPEVVSTIDEIHLETPLHIVAKGVVVRPDVERYLAWHRQARPSEPLPDDPDWEITSAIMNTTTERETYLRLLFAKGADVSARDEEGLTALHAAVKRAGILDHSLIGDDLDAYMKRVELWMTNQQNSIITILLQRGSDPNTRDFLGATPLHDAAQRGQIQLLSLLRSAGGDLLAKTRDGHTPKDLARLTGWESVYKRDFPTEG